MFERTVSLLRRLTGQHELDAPLFPESEGHDERRVYVRYPSSTETHLSPVDEPEQPTLTGRVNDVSLGGIKLQVGQPFEPGTILTVTLPGEGPACLTALACVVHCRALPGEEWALGCSFVAELCEYDLEAFGARKPKRTADDRSSSRFPCDVTALCQRPADPDLPPMRARVLNISANGMALQLEQELPTGALLSAELHGSQGQPPVTILACVVHVTVHANGQRFIGCNFIRELSTADLKKLL